MTERNPHRPVQLPFRLLVCDWCEYTCLVSDGKLAPIDWLVVVDGKPGDPRRLYGPNDKRPADLAEDAAFWLFCDIDCLYHATDGDIETWLDQSPAD